MEVIRKRKPKNFLKNSFFFRKSQVTIGISAVGSKSVQSGGRHSRSGISAGGGRSVGGPREWSAPQNVQNSWQ